jgi:hypothetical protein
VERVWADDATCWWIAGWGVCPYDDYVYRNDIDAQNFPFVIRIGLAMLDWVIPPFCPLVQ